MIKIISVCLVCFILTGCSTSEIVLRKIELTRAAIKDTIAAEIVIDSIEAAHLNPVKYDSVYRGTIFRPGSTINSRREIAAIAEFNPRTKKFNIEVPAIRDTILVYDTIKVNATDLILRGKDNTERLIWIISFMLTSIFIMIYKRYSNVRKSTKEA